MDSDEELFQWFQNTENVGTTFKNSFELIYKDHLCQPTWEDPPQELTNVFKESAIELYKSSNIIKQEDVQHIKSNQSTKNSIINFTKNIWYKISKHWKITAGLLALFAALYYIYNNSTGEY